jgi:ABC-type glycerol-3-phosphate transport system substrate-binding protein
MKTAWEPASWLGMFLLALGLVLIACADSSDRADLAAVFGIGVVLTGISTWTWWRTTGTFMQFLSDFRRWTPQK